MIGDYIRLIRQKKRLKQYNLLPLKHKSQSAKVEKNNIVFTIDILKEICTNLGLTLTEFIHITESDSQEEELLYKYRFAIKYLDREPEKKEFLNEFQTLYSKKENELSFNEFRLLFTIRATLSLYWEEIPKLTKIEITTMYNILVKQDFFSQYDYMVLCNASTLFTFTQLKNLVKKGYPVYLNNKRNHTTKNYANMFMMNVISICIYQQEYKKGLFYIDMLVRHSDRHRDYYTQINILYLKHICIGFLENDYKSFTRAFSLLDTLREIGDHNASAHLEKELNTLMKNPAYYKDGNDLEYVKVDNFD